MNRCIVKQIGKLDKETCKREGVINKIKRSRNIDKYKFDRERERRRGKGSEEITR